MSSDHQLGSLISMSFYFRPSGSQRISVVVAVILTVGLGTLVLHALLCLYTRRQLGGVDTSSLLPSGTKHGRTAVMSGRKLRKKRPRPEHLTNYGDSSTDCSL